MLLHLFRVSVALLVAWPLLLSQISVLYLAKTPAGRCLRAVFPAPAWNVSVSESAESWISPPLLLHPVVWFGETALCPAHPGDAWPDSAYLSDVHRPSGWRGLRSCDPGPPQPLTGAGGTRASPRSETVPPRQRRFFSKLPVLDDSQHRERGMTQTSDSRRRGRGRAKGTLQNFVRTSKRSAGVFGGVKVTRRLSCYSQELSVLSVLRFLLRWTKTKTIDDTHHFHE